MIWATFHKLSFKDDILKYRRAIFIKKITLKVSFHKYCFNFPYQTTLLELNLFIYLGFYVTFNTVQVISQRVVGRAEETSTYSLSGFCTVNCCATASNYQLSHLRPCRESRKPASEVGGESVTPPLWPLSWT